MRRTFVSLSAQASWSAERSERLPAVGVCTWQSDTWVGVESLSVEKFWLLLSTFCLLSNVWCLETFFRRNLKHVLIKSVVFTSLFSGKCHYKISLSLFRILLFSVSVAPEELSLLCAKYCHICKITEGKISLRSRTWGGGSHWMYLQFVVVLLVPCISVKSWVDFYVTLVLFFGNP